MRDEIKADMETNEVLMIMSEGNPGALRVCMDLLAGKQPEGFMNLLNMDDMNIRGSHIWLAYKDVCGEDLDVFQEKLSTRDSGFVATLNNVIKENHYPPEKPVELAVKGGASFK